jgi:hypothetical protein
MDGHALIDIAGEARLGEKKFLRPGRQFEYEYEYELVVWCQVSRVSKEHQEIASG